MITKDNVMELLARMANVRKILINDVSDAVKVYGMDMVHFMAEYSTNDIPSVDYAKLDELRTVSVNPELFDLIDDYATATTPNLIYKRVTVNDITFEAVTFRD